ncbi:hypothetical protein M0804_001733 [Polistes exclamans]|nr:hypothetical protein M0804_001733 [Polistes exclamans]
MDVYPRKEVYHTKVERRRNDDDDDDDDDDDEEEEENGSLLSFGGHNHRSFRETGGSLCQRGKTEEDHGAAVSWNGMSASIKSISKGHFDVVDQTVQEREELRQRVREEHQEGWMVGWWLAMGVELLAFDRRWRSKEKVLYRT